MPSPTLDLDVVLTLGVALAALALFVWDRFRLEVVGLFTMAALVVLGVLTPQEGIQGFANEATVTVALMLGLSAALVKTGAVDLLGELIGRLAGDSEWRLMAVILSLVVPVSALINNTAAVAILLPMVLGLSRSHGVTPSRVLMPLSFGGQLGGTMTLIGTSTNLLVAGIALEEGLDRFGIFSITPPAVILALVGVAYLLTVGLWITPRRESTAGSRTSVGRREYLSELKVHRASPLEGRPVDQLGSMEKLGLRPIGVWRAGRQLTLESEEVDRFRAGDRVVVRGPIHAIAEAVDREDLSLGAVAAEFRGEGLEGADVQIAELMVAPRSRAIGMKLSRVRERMPEGVLILALERHGEEMVRPIGEIEIEAGDILLARGPLERLKSLHRQGDLALLGTVDLPERRIGRLWWAVAILAAVVLLAATGIFSILMAALLGMLLMVVTGCLRPEEVYQEMDWGVIILLGTLLALGTAMQKTGAAEYLARSMLGAIRDLGPYGVLASIYFLTQAITAIVTNNAAAVVMTPVAVAAAQSMEVSPVPMVVAVMFAASNCFVTPIGYQTNVFIYGPGGYRFSDFLRVGGPLVVLQLVVATWVIPLFMPF